MQKGCGEIWERQHKKGLGHDTICTLAPGRPTKVGLMTPKPRLYSYGIRMSYLGGGCVELLKRDIKLSEMTPRLG